jgi:hypothetical protein
MHRLRIVAWWTFFASIAIAGFSYGQTTPSYSFSLATGESGSTSPELETLPSIINLPHQLESTSATATTGMTIGRTGSGRMQLTDTDLSQGITLNAISGATLALSNAGAVSETTFNYLRPYSKTELKLVNEQLFAKPAAGQSATTVRLTGFLDSAVTGIYPQERFWRNSGSTVLLISASVQKTSNGQVYSTKSSAFRLNHALNYNSTEIINSVTEVLGGANGAWNPLATNGTGYIDVSVPSDAYVVVQVSLITTTEITHYGGSGGTGLAAFEIDATARVSAAALDGGSLSSKLGLTKLSQHFVPKSYSQQTLTSAPITLNETLSSGLSPVYELISGPAAISGNTLTLDGTRGTVVFNASHPGTGTYVPVSVRRSFEVMGVAQTISFPAQADRSSNHVPFSPGATSSAGLPVQYEVVSGPATTDGSLITPTGIAGIATIRAIQSGDATFNPAVPVTQTISFTSAIPADTAQSITFPTLLHTNVGVGQLIMATSSSGLPVTLTVIDGVGELAGINRNILIPGAPGLIRVRATQAGGVFEGVSYEAASSVERTMTATSLFIQALIDAEVPEALRAPGADADGDGIANLIEFALGTNVADAEQKPAVSYDLTPTGQLTLTYQPARQDVRYFAEVSTDLVNWTAAGVDQGEADGDGAVTATAPATGSVRFIRLSVAYP